ncbi:MAG: hypothetical protein PHW62_06630, partial [Candidatus Ratteibacteria bacterium]|nr:hypothetical protein [Candidatus Ratteibacteria bacterium]
MNKKLFGIVVMGLLLVAGVSIPLYAQEPVGKVISLKGSAEAQLGEESQWRTLRIKSDIYEKDTIK